MKSPFTKRPALRGFGLVESLITIVLFAIVSGVFSQTYFSVNQASVRKNQALRADRILSDSIEAVRSIRDQNFLYLQNGDHGLVQNGNIRSFSGTQDVIYGDFTRVVTISDVYRNASGDIDSSGTELDDRTKGVAITISWPSTFSGPQQVSAQFTLADIFAFDSISSSTPEWDLGSYDSTSGSDTGDGSIILETFIEGWENSVNNTEYIYNENDNANAKSVAIQGNYLYMVGDSNAQSNNFRVLDVSQPNNVLVVAGMRLFNNILDIKISGDFAYLASVANEAELQVVDISTPSNPSVVGTLDMPDNKGMYALQTDDNYLYAGMNRNSGAEFYVLEYSNPEAPTVVGEYEVGGEVFDIEVVGTTAYLAIDDNSSSLLILDVSNPASIQLLSALSATPENRALGLDVRDSKVYIGSKRSSTTSELKVYDVSNPSSPLELGGLEVNNQINDVEIYGSYAFLTTNTTDAEFQVLDISDPANLTVVESFDMGANGNKIDANASAIYVTSDDNESPLYIFTYPQEFYSADGVYTSAPIDSGSDTTEWQSFYWDGVLESNTTVAFQIRTADTEANLDTAEWVGIDGTSETTYDEPFNIITISPSASGTRWIQYHILFSSDGSYTPEIYEVRFQYSQ